MDVFTEKLISAVKNRPLVFDKNHDDFWNSSKKKVAWAEIAKEVGGETGAVRVKWRNLRDTYRKHLKALHSSTRQPSGKSLHNWLWAESMQFFSVNMKNMENDPLSADEDPPPPRKKKKRPSRPIFAPSSISDDKESDRTNEKCIEKLDKTDYLFLSYAETFKKFTPRRKATIKFQMAKLFSEAELEEIEENDDSTITKIEMEYESD